MRQVRDDMLTLWTQITAGPVSAKLMAGALLAGIFSLMASQDVSDRGKAAATSLTKPILSEGKSQTDPDPDCSSDRHHTSQTLP